MKCCGGGVENIDSFEEDNEKIEGKNGDIKFETRKIKVGTLLKQYIEDKDIKDSIKRGVRSFNIRPNFQRYYVWNIKKATLLIESVLLGIPLPIVYLAEENDGELVVVDGQQRLQSIIYFINGRFGQTQKFKLDSRNLKTELSYDLSGKTFSELSQEYKDAILDYELTISIIKKESKPSLRYEMFFRLNQGAMPLNDMEMRVSQFQGPYLDFIKELSMDSVFKDLTSGVKEIRMKNLELVLEFFAFYEIYGDFKKYKTPKKFFLNIQMEKYKSGIDYDKMEKFTSIFRKTFRLINSIFVDHAFNQAKIHRTTGEKYYSRVFNNFLYNIISMVFAEYINEALWFEKNSRLVRENCETFFMEIDATKHGPNDYEKVYNNLKKLINNLMKRDEIASNYSDIIALDDSRKIRKSQFLDHFQWFEGNIVVKKFKMSTVGEFLRDKPYFFSAFSGDKIAKAIIENQALIVKTNNLRNFITHQDASYPIKDEDYKNWASFVNDLKEMLGK